jgi:hypothetical protein
MNKRIWFLAAALWLGGALPAAACTMTGPNTTTCPVFAVTATCQDTSSGSATVGFSTAYPPDLTNLTGSCAEPLSCDAQGASASEACPSGGGNVLVAFNNGPANFCCPVTVGVFVNSVVLVTE